MMLFPTRTLRHSFIVITGLANLLFMGSLALADQPRMFGNNPDPEELANFLFSNTSDVDDSRTWVQSGTDISVNVAALKILFEFDSIEIKPESLQTLERLAQALISPQAGFKPVVIEGHTDSVGDEIYNIDLSTRRAKTIKAHLVELYQINPERLAVKGMGESDLFNRAFPTAAINRRVQIKRLLAAPE